MLQRKKMACQILPSNDRMRMNWTPVMERYFIDLMLDQLHRGNRLGHTFNKQAWTDMLTMFNSRFATKYDRDTLKSQYSYLWKHYNDVKNLLEQSGFSWDDARKMVIASDDAWETVIKANPDAQYYRSKLLINFNDLCLIYAYTEADGRYSRSSHDIDLDEDTQGINFGIGMAGFPSGSTECVKAKWTSVMDQYFLKLMLDQIRNGNQSNNTFRKEAWKNMLTLFNTEFCFQYGKNVLKRRYKKLFKYYFEMRSILERKGFSWDGKRHKIVAEDDVWNRYIKMHPDMQSYRKKILLDYQDLHLVYGNEFSNGHQGQLHQDKNPGDVTLRVKTGKNKDSHSSAQSDVGSCWTLSMDRHFIDLLQSQALTGNKIGHELTSEAWVELIRFFKEKFGSQYNENILNKRFNHLRKQYKDIKFLLEQNGFSWDETQEMLTAKDCVWDSYIKVYPHVRSYRNKSVPSFPKLCVIYGEENCKARYNHGTHNPDLNGKPSVLMFGEGDQCLKNSDRSRPDWTPSMDRYFIDLMLDQLSGGQKINLSLDSQPWIDMAVLFNARFGRQHDKDILKWRHQILGRLFYGMKNLLDQKEFSWNGTQQLVKAHDGVWDVYTEKHPGVRSYRSSPKPDYNDLHLIYGSSISSEGQNHSGQGTMNRNCWKTDWTPPMDRFFIDLMLEHVRQGSMIDQRFNKQAWSDMAAKFSAAFGSQHGKGVLKSRFMYLRKRFHDMKSLLDQSGFAWDEQSQMIIADDGLWNAYLKNYPDARPYRDRTLPSFNDLFLIYGDINNHGTLHISSHSGVVNGCILRPNVAEEDGLSLVGCDPPQINWTKPMELYLIKLMLEQVLEGNKDLDAFNEKAWAWIVAAFNEKFGPLCDRDAAESWYLSLMKEYNNITNILNQHGFAWDETEQMITADDDDWDAYIKEHPGAMKYRDRLLDTYNELCVVYGNSVPIGRVDHLGTELEIHNNAFDMGTDGIFGDASYPTGELEISGRMKKRKSFSSSTTSASKKVPKPKKGYAQEAIAPMGAEEADGEHTSIEAIVDALQAIPGMDDEIFLEACKLLEKEEEAKGFVSMDVNQRKNWLIRKLYR